MLSWPAQFQRTVLCTLRLLALAPRVKHKAMVFQVLAGKLGRCCTAVCRDPVTTGPNKFLNRLLGSQGRCATSMLVLMLSLAVMCTRRSWPSFTIVAKQHFHHSAPCACLSMALPVSRLVVALLCLVTFGRGGLVHALTCLQNPS